jgi:HEPN domain-containing protein
MITAAETLDPVAPGTAGLAYQAANLAVKALLTEVDGGPAWQYGEREERAAELLGIDASQLAFLHHVRQTDFYADTGFGGETALPTPEECHRALKIARQVVDAAMNRISR